MDNRMENNLFFKNNGVSLYLGDSFELLKKIQQKSVDMIFADPPYFLSSGGITNSGGRMVSVNKGDWDKRLTVEDKHLFNREWIRLCKDVMSDKGTIWISGTLHNIYSIGLALEQEGFKILNNITWQKTNPPPNLGCRNFTHSTETIIWAKKDIKAAKHIFNYKDMKETNNGKQMKDVWSGGLTPKNEKKLGNHPRQKPLYILERILLASTEKGDKVLDPFIGSGTTALACENLQREIMGFDISEDYLKIARKRIEQISIQQRLF